jgi:hypothetical protein
MAAVLGSVVVGDFDFAGIAARPAETETPLIIDADAVLAGAFAVPEFFGRFVAETFNHANNVPYFRTKRKFGIGRW